MTYSDYNDTNRRSQVRAARVSRGFSGETRYLALLTSIIPALAILAAAASLLMAAG